MEQSRYDAEQSETWHGESSVSVSHLQRQHLGRRMAQRSSSSSTGSYTADSSDSCPFSRHTRQRLGLKTKYKFHLQGACILTCEFRA